MQNVIKKVDSKLNEYGIKIFKQHAGDEDQYVFFCQDMVVFAYPDNSISISFQATATPDNVAQSVLILKEIPALEIDIMESFLYRDDNKLLIGEEAHKLVKNTISTKAIKKYMTEQSYDYLLENVKGHDC